DFNFASDATGVQNIIVVRSAAHQIWIQKISLAITTHDDETVTFQDTSTSPVVIANHEDAAAATDENIVWDFGPQGTPLEVGENLHLALSGAGIAGKVHIEAYATLLTPTAYDAI